MQLNKYLAHAGITSRRKAALLIKEGHVTVNNTVVKQSSYLVKENDIVKVNNKKIQPEKKLYLLLNKPEGYITTTDDLQGRTTVMDLIRIKKKVRLYPVGRLDIKTTGLLLITNDGDLTQQLAHPKYKVKKVYRVIIDKPLTHHDYLKIKKGIRLKDGKVTVDAIHYEGKSKYKLKVTIHSGKYRVIRRLFKQLGYNVVKLDRIIYAGLTKKRLPLGKWRFLTAQEIKKIKNLSLGNS